MLKWNLNSKLKNANNVRKTAWYNLRWMIKFNDLVFKCERGEKENVQFCKKKPRNQIANSTTIATTWKWRWKSLYSIYYITIQQVHNKNRETKKSKSPIEVCFLLNPNSNQLFFPKRLNFSKICLYCHTVSPKPVKW